MDTLGLITSVLIYQGVLISQVILCETFRTITKCLDYAGVLTFKCPD